MVIPKITEQKFKEALENNTSFLLVFYATWSGSCELLLSLLEQIVLELPGLVKVYKIDAVRNKDLMNKHHIKSIPSILLIRDGKVQDSISGIVSKPILKLEIEKLF